LFCLGEGNGAGLDRKKGGKITNPDEGSKFGKKTQYVVWILKGTWDKQTTIMIHNMDIGKIF
jgi:hypothetical protein